MKKLIIIALLVLASCAGPRVVHHHGSILFGSTFGGGDSWAVKGNGCECTMDSPMDAYTLLSQIKAGTVSWPISQDECARLRVKIENGPHSVYGNDMKQTPFKVMPDMSPSPAVEEMK